MLEFQNLLKSTITFCVIHVVCTSKWALRPRKSQRVVQFSKWHAYKFSLRTQTQPSSMHQLGVKNTPHHRHRHATTNYVTKWVGFNWKTRHFPPLAFLRGHWPKRRQKNPPEVFPQDRTAHSENYFVRSYAKWWIQKVYLDKSLRSVEARARGCKVVSQQQQTIGDLNAFWSLLGDPIFKIHNVRVLRPRGLGFLNPFGN